jgi:DNA topoisomerase-3
MKVIIAEKPSVARDIARVVGATESKIGYLEGNGFLITWAIGHLISLASPEKYLTNESNKNDLPIIPKKFELEVRSSKKNEDPGLIRQLTVIKNVFNRASEIIVATDAGREGELIFRYIYYYLKCKVPFSRLWISSLTEKAITDGLQKLKKGQDYDTLYFAAKARSEADWLIGINASRALSRIAFDGIYSLGRVQTPTLKMIVERYKENTEFKKVPFWQIQLAAEKGGLAFSLTLSEKFFKNEDAERLLQELKEDNKFSIIDITTIEKNLKPPLLFDLTGLQKTANKKYHFPAAKTLAIAQALYEKKLITYPRTGSTYISDDIFDNMPDLLTQAIQRTTLNVENLNMSQLPKHCVSNENISDHHALIVTENEPKGLNDEESKIYQMVLLRMLASFSAECYQEQIKISASAGNHIFQCSQTKIINPGWKTIETGDEESSEDEIDQILPAFTKGEVLTNVKLDILERSTKPKALFTEATLLAAMENAGKDASSAEGRSVLKSIGLGTPATRAATIEVLLSRSYIKRQKNQIVPTERGISVFDIVKSMRIANVDLTAEWEDALEKIQSGKLKPESFSEAINIYTQQATEEILSVKIGEQTFCPKCQNAHVRFFKKLVKCSDDHCQWIAFKYKANKILTDDQVRSLVTKGKTELIKGFTNKVGKSFDAFLSLNNNQEITFEFPKRMDK